MALRDKTIRQSVTLPVQVATQVEEGIEEKKQKEKAFFELAEHFRTETDPKEVERLGEKLGQMVFGR